ncbi:MAG TPA: hypothetical protein VG826_23810 [Pirellulales bacterium]|nr:hypothetical protein [Pirellulales bacterium]
MRPQFSLKTMLAWMAVAAVIACVGGFALRLQAELGRFYGGFRKAQEGARAQGKELTMNEWMDRWDAEMAAKNAE